MDMLNDLLSVYTTEKYHLEEKTMAKKAYVPTPEEFKRLLKTVSVSNHAKRDTLLILLSYGCGLRAIELAGLKVSDVIATDGSIIESVLLHRTKGDIKRNMYLVDKKIKSALLDYLEERKSHAHKKRVVFSHSQPLFLSQKNGAFTNLTIARRFENIYKMAGIIGATSHSGRRTFATNLIEKGLDIKSVSILMGHSNIQSTADYVQDNPERLKRITASALY